MRFRAKNETERVKEAIKANQGIAEENGHKHNMVAENKKAFSQKEGGITSLARKTTSALSYKTHFQAVLALVNRQSKTLSKPVESDIIPGLREGEEIKFCGNSIREKNRVFSQNATRRKKRKPQTALIDSLWGRSESLPLLRIDNTTPLKEGKYPSSHIDDETIKYLLATRDNVATSENYEGTKIKAAKQVRIQTSISPFPLTPQTLTPNGEREEMAKRVLSLCRVTHLKSPKSPQQALKKGEGHMMIGFGKTNREIYEHLFS